MMTLLYPKSDPLFIGYRPSQDRTIPTYVTTSQEIEADINAFVRQGTSSNNNHQESLLAPSCNTLLVGSGNKLTLLQLALSTIMERGQLVSEEPAAQEETQPPQLLTED